MCDTVGGINSINTDHRFKPTDVGDTAGLLAQPLGILRFKPTDVGDTLDGGDLASDHLRFKPTSVGDTRRAR